MNAPFEHFFELGSLSAAGLDVKLAAKPDECVRIAQWDELQAVNRFEAVVSLTKLSRDRFSYKATLTADAVQSCVVSLAPVTAHIEKTFERELHVVSHLPRDTAAYGDHPIGEIESEDGPEDIESTRFDLAAPLLEEFLLALDLYPRAPGVVFESPEGFDAKPENPFAVLKALKEKE